MASTPSRTKVDLTIIKYAAWIAAALSFGGTIFLIVSGVTRASEDVQCSFDQLRASIAGAGDMTCIKIFWDSERDSFATSFAFDMFEAIGALLVIPVVVSLGHAFGNHLAASKAMVSAFVFTLGVNTFELAVRAGQRSVADWLTSSSWNLGDEQLRSVTLTYILNGAQFSWLFSLDELLLGVGFVCAAVLVFRHGMFPKWFAWLSVVAGVLSIVNFGLEIARLGSWGLFSIIGFFVAAVVGFILFPIWLIVVGCYLEMYAPPSDSRGSPLMEGDDAGASVEDVGVSTSAGDDAI